MSKVKWTVSILLQYYDEDIFAYDVIKKAILAQRNHENVKYYIFKYDVLRDMADILTVKIETGQPILYVDKQIPECQDLYESPEKYWRPFFDEYAVLQNADYNFLMTCGHGAGFGFVTRDKLPEPFLRNEKAKKRFDYLKQIFSTGTIGFNKQKIEDSLFSLFDELKVNNLQKKAISKSGFDIIPLEILSVVLQGSFKKPIDFWYARNCYMQMFESGYILKSKVKYLIGSENFVFNVGIDYEKLFEELGNNESGENHFTSIANNVCNNLPLRYGNEAFLRLLEHEILGFSRKSVKFISQSVNKLESYIKVRGVIDEMANHFLKNKILYRTIKVVREKCKDVSVNPYGIVDLINFCKKLQPEIDDPQLKEILERFIEIITKKSNNVVIAHYFPKDGYTPAKRLAIFPYGVSIFFPEDKKESENDQYIDFFMTNFYKQKKDFTNDFLADSSWPLFVVDYYEHPF